MKKKNCMECVHCILRPMAYHEGTTNTCEFKEKIENLTQEALLTRIIKNECEWFENGEPKVSNDICYDD